MRCRRQRGSLQWVQQTTQEYAKRHSGSTPTRTIPARSPQRVRGSVPNCAKTHSGSAPTRTIPAGVQQTTREYAKKHSRSAPIRTIPQRVHGSVPKCAKTHSGSAPTRTIPSKGVRFSFKRCENAQRGRSDTHDPRRGVHRASRGENPPQPQKQERT